MTDAKEIVRLLSMYLEMFPEYRLSSAGLAMYAGTLQKYPIEQIRTAMEKLINERDRFPKPCHIINAIDELKVHVLTNGKGVPSVGEAWSEMIQQANRYGFSFEKWEFSTPEIERAVVIFGKDKVMTMFDDDSAINKAQFRRDYENVLKAVAERKRNDEALAGSSLSNLVNRLAENSRKVFLTEGR